jgi:hypothetical protein
VVADKRVPLHVTSRVFTGHDTLMSTIDSELEKVEQCCSVQSCDVTLTGDAKNGYRATVALELDGGRCVSHSACGDDLVHSIVQAFTVCRARGQSSEE